MIGAAVNHCGVGAGDKVVGGKIVVHELHRKRRASRHHHKSAAVRGEMVDCVYVLLTYRRKGRLYKRRAVGGHAAYRAVKIAANDNVG